MPLKKGRTEYEYNDRFARSVCLVRKLICFSATHLELLMSHLLDESVLQATWVIPQ
jgi:hypothetical protein